jgi:hypothetical protein
MAEKRHTFPSRVLLDLARWNRCHRLSFRRRDVARSDARDAVHLDVEEERKQVGAVVGLGAPRLGGIGQAPAAPDPGTQFLLWP